MSLRVSSFVAVLASMAVLMLAGCSDSGSDGDVGSRGSLGSDAGSPFPGGAANPEDERRNALMLEYQQLQQRLGRIQQEAFADSVMQARYTVIEGRVEEEMTVLDPEYPQKRDRMTALEQEMQTARDAGDQEAMQRIGEEGNVLYGEIQSLQTRVVEVEHVAAELDAFRKEIEARMIELDPETPQLMARSEEILTQLQAMDASASSPIPGG